MTTQKYSYRNVRSLYSGDVFIDPAGIQRTVVNRFSVPSGQEGTAILLSCNDGEVYLYSRRDQVKTLLSFS